MQDLPDLVLLDLTIDSKPTPTQVVLTATVLNEGHGDANDVLVTFYEVNDANFTQIADDVTIELLGPHEARDVSVTWDVTEGIHNIFVVLDYLNTISETNENNNYVSRTFCAGWESQGDLNNDCIVNSLDLAVLADKWLDFCSDSDWCEGNDFNRDGQVNLEDILILCENWLWEVSGE